jgi:hypothetical protein
MNRLRRIDRGVGTSQRNAREWKKIDKERRNIHIWSGRKNITRKRNVMSFP